MACMQVVSRQEWLAASKALWQKEKEMTRVRAALAEERRALPMVKVDKEYTFKGPGGQTATLSDLFEGKDQLIIYHFMFGPGEETGCYGCTHVGEALPNPAHMKHKNVNIVCVSRADADVLEARRQTAGWTWKWYSSGGTDFNTDFNATIDATVAQPLLNFETKEERESRGRYMRDSGDVQGLSVFLKKDGEIYHTYSTWERGLEVFIPTFALLDMVPQGRRDTPHGPGDFRLPQEYEDE